MPLDSSHDLPRALMALKQGTRAAQMRPTELAVLPPTVLITACMKWESEFRPGMCRSMRSGLIETLDHEALPRCTFRCRALASRPIS